MMIKHKTIIIAILLLAAVSGVCIAGQYHFSGSDRPYTACSYIVARDGHYNIGVEVHCKGRSPAWSLMFGASEFGDLVTELPDDPDDGRNYCEAIPGANTMKEWITVSIEDKDLDKVISQLKKHVFEIDLVDPEGNYEEIHEKTRLKLVKAI